MRPCVFACLLALAILAGQGIAVLGSRYLSCMDAYGAQFCNEYIASRAWRQP